MVWLCPTQFHLVLRTCLVSSTSRCISTIMPVGCVSLFYRVLSIWWIGLLTWPSFDWGTMSILISPHRVALLWGSWPYLFVRFGWSRLGNSPLLLTTVYILQWSWSWWSHGVPAVLIGVNLTTVYRGTCGSRPNIRKNSVVPVTQFTLEFMENITKLIYLLHAGCSVPGVIALNSCLIVQNYLSICTLGQGL